MGKNVTFLIGNGFDLNVGLKTHYTDFYEIYTKENVNDNENIQKFKKEILRNEADGWKNWIDFEIGMGKQSTCFDGNDPVKDFIDCFDDFVINFNEYLINECNTINWDTVDTTICNKFTVSLMQFCSYLKSVLCNTILDLLRHPTDEEAKLNILQFIYTNAFDKLVEKSNLSNQLHALLGNYGSQNSLNTLGLNLHVHGAINGGHPTIGVNDESQIANETIKMDPRVGQIFIKPKFLDILQRNNVNANIPRTNALKAITESTIICVFGMSMGASDKFWWKKIGEWLKNTGGVLIIFDISDGVDDGISPRSFLNREINIEHQREEIIKRVISYSDINQEWLNKNPDKIIVELNSEMFAFELPKKVNLKTEQMQAS